MKHPLLVVGREKENNNSYKLLFSESLMKVKKVGLGSMNPVKFRAVSYVLHSYLGVMPCNISQIRADSGVRVQPLERDEIIRGAKNRAEQALKGSDLGIGIESGVYPSDTSAGYENVCVCALYDGKRFVLGKSFPFELPPEITRKIVFGRMEMDEAVVKAELSTNPNIGEDVGLIGLLTDNRITREYLVREAVTAAVMQIKNKKCTD